MSWTTFIPVGATIPEQKFNNAWGKNSDGARIAYAKNDQLFVTDVIKTFDNFKKLYEEIGVDCPRLITFRSAYLYKSDVNVGPFKINDNLAMAQHHSSAFAGSGDYSDVCQYIDKIIAPFFADYTRIDVPELQWMVAESIGSYCTAVFLTKQGHGIILNANKGEYDKEIEDLWFSSLEHMYPKTISSYPSTSVWASQSSVRTQTPSNSISSSDTVESYLTWLRKQYIEAVLNKQKASQYVMEN